MTLIHAVLALGLAAVLTGCGGGGGGGADAVDGLEAPANAAPAAAASATASLTGSSCATGTNADVFGGLTFHTAHRFNTRDYGCLIVPKGAGYPVFDGAGSARFEVRDGDCSSSDSYDDCANDRSRHEINETTQLPSNGQTLAYTTHVLIPEHARLKPHGKNTLFLTQINFKDAGDVYGTLAYLEVADNGDLLVRTSTGFTFSIEKQYPVYSRPAGKWVKVVWEIRSSTGPDGYLKVYVDDVLKVDERRATLPSATAFNRLRVGIYNVFRSKAQEPYGHQVVYFDGISKSVR